MSKRGARFQMLPREHTKGLEPMAFAANEAEATPLADGLAHAQTAFDLFFAREKGAASAEDARPPMLLSSVREGDAEKAHMESLLTFFFIALRRSGSRTVAQQLRPEATSTTRRKLMEKQPVLTPPKLVQSRWLPLVCWHRNEFAPHSFGDQLGRRCAILWAKQRPQLACFSPMRPDTGRIFEAHVTRGGQGVHEALRRFAHFISRLISTSASGSGWVDAANRRRAP